VPLPPRRRENGNGDGQTEKDLSQSGMADGNRRREQEQYRNSTQNPLAHNRNERADAQPSHPFSGFLVPEPERENHGEQSYGGSRQSVPMLISHASDHLGKDLAVR